MQTYLRLELLYHELTTLLIPVGDSSEHQIKDYDVGLDADKSFLAVDTKSNAVRQLTVNS